MQPALTVGVPHLDRTEFLAKTLACLKAQTKPCTILVADQGKTDATAALMEKYQDDPSVVHVKTHASCLWENWQDAAYEAMERGSQYFAWCQDDDIVHPRYSERIHMAFEGFPQADTWTAFLAIAEHEHLALKQTTFGPMAPMDLMRNFPTLVKGELLTPLSYFLSWALSPAVAFRCGPRFHDALGDVPASCDLYTERTILAAIGKGSHIVCDPVVAGYWRHHGKNESFRQNVHKKPEQLKQFLEWTDARMDGIADWAEGLAAWARVMPNNYLAGYIQSLAELKSRYSFAVADVLSMSMREETTYDEIRRRLHPQPNQAMII